MNDLQTTSAPDATSIAQKRILVLDDNPYICVLMDAWLRAAGHTVQTASGGRKFIAPESTDSIDVIITDIVMPEGDGYEVIEAVKSAHPDTKIIAMSGGGSRLPGMECLKLARILGADEILQKPFTRRHVLDALNRVLE
jgi:CheY-like chemotaxis protein